MGDLFRADRRAGRWSREDAILAGAGLVVVVALLGLVALSLERINLQMWGAVLVALVLMLASAPLCRWVARVEGDPWLFKVLMVGLACVFLFSGLRYSFTYVLYDGGDSTTYHQAGHTFVDNLRSGRPLHPIPVIEPYPVETRRVGDIAGLFYVVTGPNIYAGFLAFSYVSFLGVVMMIRAFRVAVPEGDHRRLALLVLFLPSMLFWPAGIGKEAVMMACLGVIVFGGALLLAPKPRLRGVAYFAGGAAIVLLIRPHIALMSVLAFGVAIAIGVLARSGGDGASARGRAFRLAGLFLVVALGIVGSARLGQQFEEFSEDGTAATLAGATEQSSTGGSQFTPVAVTSPASLPGGIVSVLLRPFPFEASSVAELVASAEGVLLLAILLLSWRRLARFPRLALQRPFLVFMSGYIVLFAIGFSYIANFGILSRQRVLVLPAVLMLAALPIAGRRTAPERGVQVGEPAPATTL